MVDGDHGGAPARARGTHVRPDDDARADGDVGPRVADLMTRSVYTLASTQSLPLADAMMSLHRIRHVPVIDANRRVVGLVTHRDVMAAKISSLAPLDDAERSSLQLAVPVSRVMRSPVWTIAPEATAVTAARIMLEHRFGCLPVVDDGVLVGILAEADLLRLVVAPPPKTARAAPLTMANVMTRVPVTITPNTTIAEARATMARYGIRHLPVIEDGKAIAVVRDRDIAVAEIIFRDSGQAPAAHVVRLIGDARVHRVGPRVRVDAVVSDMYREHFEAVLVVDGDALVGIFTDLDACRLLALGVTWEA